MQVSNKMTKLNIAAELIQFFWSQSWWWLTPMIFALLLLSVLINFAQTSTVTPFIYALY